MLVVQDGSTDEDPAKQFIGSTLATASLQCQQGHAAGTVITAALATPLGAAVAIRLKPQQNSSVTTFTVDLSVDLVLRDA